MNICWLPILHYSFMKKSLKVKSPRETEKQSSDSVNVNKSKGHMKFKFRRGGGRGGERKLNATGRLDVEYC